MTYKPSVFVVETFVGCNLKCPECSWGSGQITRKSGYLTLDNFKIIAEKIKPYAGYVYLHCWGEPLLNPQIFDIIEYGQKLFRTQISTNGQNITKEYAEKLVMLETDLCFALDGMTQEIYETYRIGGNMQKTIDAIKMVAAAKKKYNKKGKIQVNFLVLKHNQHQIQDFLNFCKTVEVEECLKSPAIRCGSNIQNSDIKEYVRNNIKLTPEAMIGCNILSMVFTIYLDGSVVLCCYDYDGITTYGNIYNQDVLEIYNNNKMNNIRASMPCSFCKERCLGG